MAARLRIATVAGGVVLVVLALLLLLPATALAQGPRITAGSGTIDIGPRILGESEFVFELDALSQDEVSRPGWPVTTTRASTRMCLGPGGQWQTVPENTPCIGASGLASFGPGTNYITNSTAPTLTLSGGATVATVTEGGVTFQRITMPAGSKAEIVPAAGPVLGDAVVATVEVKGSGAFLLSPETSTTGARAVTLGAAWARESFGRTSTTAPRVVMHATSASVVDLGQAQLERGRTTPGPRHDCGASACSWERDHHDADPGVLPVVAGEIRFRATLQNMTTLSWLLDTRSANGLGGLALYVDSSGAVRGFVANSSTAAGFPEAAAGPRVVQGQEHEYRLVWNGANYTAYLDGVQVWTTTSGIPLTTHSAFRVGRDRFASPLNGHIRILRVSQ